MIFLMYATIIQCLNYNETRMSKTQFAVYVSDTLVTLKQGQGHEV